MRIDWDVPVKMDDGITLRADVFRPPKEGNYPSILSYGPYAKWLPFQMGYPQQWERMVKQFPDVLEGSTNKYQAWEVVDPEKWVPDGYAVVRFDSRGSGRSPGVVAPYSKRETLDLYQCIEWAGKQSWSNGRVGLCGISYYAVNQWQVAALQPKHLAAIIPWEGSNDPYRDAARHGGIFSLFRLNWFGKQVMTVQHGLGTRGFVSPVNGELVSGPETLSDKELAKNRHNPGLEFLEHVLDDEYYKERRPDYSKIEVPLLSCANWGGAGLHLRGNVEGFLRAASKQKWLEFHGETHWKLFYTRYGVDLQKKFFDHFLKGLDNGWEKEPKVLLNVRTVDGFFQRSEEDWPIQRTRWTKYYLDYKTMTLSTVQSQAEQKIEYEALGDGLTFFSAPLEEETEITGPSAAKLFVSSSTTDADLFLVLRVFDPKGKEVVFQGALDPHTPIAQGWLRASHRKLDNSLSTPYKPYHSHDALEPLVPDKIYELDVEIWPTCIVVPKGYKISFTVRGKDYEYSGETDRLTTFANEFKGCGPFIHTDPRDRPESVFGGKTTLHSRNSFVLLPIIPKKSS
ncbi:MAG: CocE/NonD family hydrolase [Nitrososphaerota archaeon]|nr:CocE/NonD family hydrolase [Nitrososphaerota archaeon]